MDGRLMRLRFDMIGAHEAGRREHPQRVIMDDCERRGVRPFNFEPVPIGDCWLFEVTGTPNLPWPDYIIEIPRPPGRMVG
jgi:hypothetical protein